MKQGKKICETLKAIRSEIASANEIEYTPIKCTHKGDCAGTCPACESETRWLERQLRLRHALGKAVTIAGVSVAFTVAASAASTSSLGPDKKKAKHRQLAVMEEQTDGYIQQVRQELVTSDSVLIKREDDRRKARTMGIVPMFRPHTDSIYTNVDVEAYFPEGDAVLDSLIRDQLYIPDEILAPIKEMKGTVKARCIVKALVELDGTISDAVIEKTTTADIFDNEALRVVKNLPRFCPAVISDIPVRSWTMIPVEFIYDFSNPEPEIENKEPVIESDN